MTVEQPGLFDEVEAVGPVTLEVMRAYTVWGSRADPRTGLPRDEAVAEQFREQTFYWGHGPGTEYEVEGFGRFVILASWPDETKDEDEQGVVIKDLNTNIEYLFESTYSSWDSSEWTVEVAESYTFTETRWRKKK